jgi:hypothetical protein
MYVVSGFSRTGEVSGVSRTGEVSGFSRTYFPSTENASRTLPGIPPTKA